MNARGDRRNGGNIHLRELGLRRIPRHAKGNDCNASGLLLARDGKRLLGDSDLSHRDLMDMVVLPLPSRKTTFDGGVRSCLLDQG